MSDKEVTLCNSCGTADVNKYTTVDSVLKTIKNGIEPFTSLIKQARGYGKGTKAYDSIKRYRVPTINWTGIFKSPRSINTFIRTSGYIYYDIDSGVDENTVNLLKHFEFVKAIWRSFGGDGLGFLIRVDGITKDNYKTTWAFYADAFIQNGIEIRVDKSCKDISRINVLSYDPDLWVNDNVVAAEAVEFYAEIEDKDTPTTPSFGLSTQTEDETERACINAFNLAVNRHGNFIKGSRHQAKVLYFSTCNVFGVPLDTAISFLEFNSSCEEIIKTGNSIYSLYERQHGTKANNR